MKKIKQTESVSVIREKIMAIMKKNYKFQVNCQKLWIKLLPNSMKPKEHKLKNKNIFY